MISSQRGDTIVEVLFAITVFSVIAVTSLALMNQGTATVQRALEISHVRNEIDAQADGLRYIHDAYVNSLSSGAAGAGELWETITNRVKPSGADDFGNMISLNVCGGEDQFNSTNNAFALNIRDLDNTSGDPLITTNFQLATTYAKIRNDTAAPQADGIWIEAVRGSSISSSTPIYYDFHIRACWIAPGQSTPVTLGTIVRLYEPES